MSNRFTSRLSDDDDFKRDELIRKITPKSQQKINRNHYLSTSYVTSPKEGWGKSLHSAEKCCIFAPAIEGTAFCASFRSSIKTSKGHK